LMDTAQYQDVIKQIVDRVAPAFADRQALCTDWLQHIGVEAKPTPQRDALSARAAALVQGYLAGEDIHRDPDTCDDGNRSAGASRIELF